jgi:trehalose 6-phosphate phosphatase
MADPFEPLLADPARGAVITDYDGTLAPIVDDPGAAAPFPGSVEALHALARRYGLVGVVSGRPLEFLVSQLGEGDLWLCGLYGLESSWRGDRAQSPEAIGWRGVVAEVVGRAVAVFGIAVEDKGLSLTIHFRTAPELGPEVRAWAAVEGERTGLQPRQAKASVELHPPVAADKGTAIVAAVAGLGAVCFIGDDVGDLPAFDALDQLGTTGVHVVRVAVQTEEAPLELLARADVVVDGSGGVFGLLERLRG